MELTTKDTGNACIVELEGSLDTNSANDAHVKLEEIIDAGAVNLVINVDRIDFISSSGLRVLLAIAKTLSARKGTLILTNLNETVREVFRISGFDSILTVCQSEEEALSRLDGQPGS